MPCYSLGYGLDDTKWVGVQSKIADDTYRATGTQDAHSTLVKIYNSDAFECQSWSFIKSWEGGVNFFLLQLEL